MKRISFLILAGFMAMACSGDDDASRDNVNGNATAVRNNLKSGTWRITGFTEDGNDETNHFSGYNFSFAENGTVTASNGTNTYNGSWSVTDSDSSDDDDNNNDDIDFDIAFAAPAEFTDLTDDWDVMERTGTRLRLVDVSGGNGGTDYLTFEKN